MKPRIADAEDADIIDLTPMIDIVFLLIVFFMTVASMITAERIPLTMPVAPNSSIPEDFGKRTTLTVMRDGSIYAGVYSVSLNELPALLTRELEEKPDIRVYLRADSAVEHQYVNDVMQACAAAGISNIVFAAYQSDK